jgi:hypothetical protein
VSRRSSRSSLIPALALTCLYLAAAVPAEAQQLTWSPPQMTGATTLRLTTDRTHYVLDPAVDYVLKLPHVYDRGGLIIQGGRNVTLIGGHIWVPGTGATQLGPRRGLLLLDQRGKIHVEGVQIDGPGLSEGIQMGQTYGATVQLQRIFVGHVRARDTVGFTDNHPDVVQTWAGPKRLLIDDLSGTTDFQGLFLDPLSSLCSTDACRPSTVYQRTWDFRNIDIKGAPSARVLYWTRGGFPIAQHNLWGRPAEGRSIAASLWPSVAAWYGVTAGAPPTRMVSPEQVGEGYVQASSYKY